MPPALGAPQPTKLHVRKIQGSELSKSFAGNGVVGFGRCDCIVKLSQQQMLPTNADSCSPSSLVFKPRDASKDSIAASSHVAVCEILGARGNAEVASAVVQPISVNVVNLKPRGRSQNSPVHEDHRGGLRIGRLAVSDGIAADCATPFVRQNQLSIGFVNYRDSAFGQGNGDTIAVHFDPPVECRAGSAPTLPGTSFAFGNYRA